MEKFKSTPDKQMPDALYSMPLVRVYFTDDPEWNGYQPDDEETDLKAYFRDRDIKRLEVAMPEDTDAIEVPEVQLPEVLALLKSNGYWPFIQNRGRQFYTGYMQAGERLVFD